MGLTSSLYKDVHYEATVCWMRRAPLGGIQFLMTCYCTFQLVNKFSYHNRFIEKLQQDIPGKGVKEQLQILCNVYALFLVHKHLGDFLSTGSITAKQASLANDQLRSLYSQVFPLQLSCKIYLFIFFEGCCHLIIVS